jgi:hypothetical protein
LIDDLEIAFDANRAIIDNRYFGSCHEVLQEIGEMFEKARTGYVPKIMVAAVEYKEWPVRSDR